MNYKGFQRIGSQADSFIKLQCLFICLSVPFSCNFYRGLSLALRSHDQIPASHWSTPPFQRFKHFFLAVLALFSGYSPFQRFQHFLAVLALFGSFSPFLLISALSAVLAHFSSFSTFQQFQHLLAVLSLSSGFSIETDYVPKGYSNTESRACTKKVLNL